MENKGTNFNKKENSNEGINYWNEVFEFLSHKLSKDDINRWFGDINYVSYKNDILVVSTSSNFAQDRITKKYKNIIQEFLAEISNKNIDFRVAIEKPKNNQPRHKITAPKEEAPPITKKNTLAIKKHPSLTSRYTFDNFIIGENNTFGANASIAISRAPGSTYNPFLLYGGVGLGKTHLIQSIGNYIYHNVNTENLKVIYTTTENFMNEFIQSIREKKTAKLKNKYRNADVLLLDDIQFLQKKVETQEELFHTFNALYDTNKQMVFTCDRHVDEIQDITDRLKSRFKRGLNVDLKPPSYETRVAILRKKIEEMQISDIFLDEKILYLIAELIITNVRDLESALTKLVAYARLVNKTISAEIVREQLDITLEKKPQRSIFDIQKIVSEYFNISTIDIKGSSRKKGLVFPRHVAMYITREITDFSTTEIGLEFGGKDHTTVMNACQKIKGMLLTDSNLSSNIRSIIKLINNL